MDRSIRRRWYFVGVLLCRRLYRIRCGYIVPCTVSFKDPFFFTPNPLPLSLQLLTTFTFQQFPLLWLKMSPSRKPMPSFTLVLTSGSHSLPPTTTKFGSCTAPKMLPTAPDYLMVRMTEPIIYFFVDFHRSMSENYRFTWQFEGWGCPWPGRWHADHFWSRKACDLWSWSRANYQQFYQSMYIINGAWTLHSHFHQQTLLHLIRRFVKYKVKRNLVNNGPLPVSSFEPSLN